MKQANKLALALALLALGYGPANAAPVVYSAYAVTDGQLGSWTFTRAMVVIRLKGDTRNTVTTTQGSATVYINDVGSASVTINKDGKSVTAHLDPNQVFARLDLANGEVGFGSAASPFYPISISCFDEPAGCDSSHAGLAGRGTPTGLINDALVDVIGAPGDSTYYSAALNAQTQDDLRGPALITGHAILCSNFNFNFPGVGCPATLPAPITTDKGNLYFTGQDDSEKGVFRALVERDDN
jgi:hypothetical protein